MNAATTTNVVTVKNVAEKTREGRFGHSISLATFYNNGKLLYDFVEFIKSLVDPSVLDELNAYEREISELKDINAALIRRDIKFEKMQAEIDTLRNELKLARDFREANAMAEAKQLSSKTSAIPSSLKGPKS